MENNIDAKIKFAEDLIGRPLEEHEKKWFTFYCEYLEENPRLSVVMARRSGHNSALAWMAQWANMYYRGEI